MYAFMDGELCPQTCPLHHVILDYHLTLPGHHTRVRRMAILAENGMLGTGNVPKISINSLLRAVLLLVQIRFPSKEVAAVGLLQFQFPIFSSGIQSI